MSDTEKTYEHLGKADYPGFTDDDTCWHKQCRYASRFKIGKLYVCGQHTSWALAFVLAVDEKAKLIIERY